MHKELNEVLIDFQSKLSELKSASELIGKAKDAAVSTSALAEQMQLDHSQLYKKIHVEVESARKIKDEAAKILADAEIELIRTATNNFTKINKEIRDGFNELLLKIDHLTNEEVRALSDFSQKADSVLKKVQDSITVNIGEVKKQSVNAAKSTETVLIASLQTGIADLLSKNNEVLNSINSTVDKGIKNLKNELADGRKESGNATNNISNDVKLIRDDSRQFYTNFERLLGVKLDENKAGIKQLIEYERDQVRSIVDYRIQSSENHIQTDFKRHFDSVAKQQKTLLTTLWVFGGLLVMLTSLGLGKLFGIF